MTSPDDDDLAEALRRALSEAANGVEPGSDGLDKIYARIGDRTPRPWLISVLYRVVERARNWTWHGHWTRPAWLPRLAGVRWPHLLRDGFPALGARWLRLAAVVSAVAVIAGIMLGVQPVRDAILQVSTALQGGSEPSRATAGTEGNGERTVGTGHGTPSSSGSATQGGGQTSPGGSPGVPGTRGAAHSPATGGCTPSPPLAAANVQPSLTNMPPPATQTPAPVVSVMVTPAQPAYTDTQKAACAKGSPAKSPTPTPTPSGGSSSPAPTSTSASPTPTPTPTPDDTSPASAWPPAPTAQPTPSAQPTPTAQPTPAGTSQGSAAHPVPAGKGQASAAHPTPGGKDQASAAGPAPTTNPAPVGTSLTSAAGPAPAGCGLASPFGPPCRFRHGHWLDGFRSRHGHWQ